MDNQDLSRLWGNGRRTSRTHVPYCCFDMVRVGSVLSFSVTGDRFSCNDQVLRNNHPAMFSCNDQVLRNKHPAVLQQKTALPHFWAMTLAA